MRRDSITHYDAMMNSNQNELVTTCQFKENEFVPHSFNSNNKKNIEINIIILFLFAVR